MMMVIITHSRCRRMFTAYIAYIDPAFSEGSGSEHGTDETASDESESDGSEANDSQENDEPSVQAEIAVMEGDFR